MRRRRDDRSTDRTPHRIASRRYFHGRGAATQQDGYQGD